MSAEYLPVGRFEWERLVRRVRIPADVDGVKIPKPSVMRTVALTLASYANADGSRVRPGLPRLAAVTQLSKSSVSRAVTALRSLGLVERVVCGSANGRRGWSDEYRLTVPADLLEVMELLPPDEIPGSEQDSQVTPVLRIVGQEQDSHVTPDPAEQVSRQTRTGVTGDTPPLHHQPLQQPQHSRLSSTVTLPTRESEPAEQPKNCPHRRDVVCGSCRIKATLAAWAKETA